MLLFLQNKIMMPRFVLIICLVCCSQCIRASSGYLVGWGYASEGGNSHIITNVLTDGGRLMGGIKEVCPSWNRSGLLLKDDGALMSFGGEKVTKNLLPGTSNIVQVAGNDAGGLALKNDGKVAVWDNGTAFPKVPDQATNIVQVAVTAGSYFALNADGRVIAWGWLRQPENLTNFAAISTSTQLQGENWGLNRDGTVIDWKNQSPDVYPIVGLSNVAAIAVGPSECLALKNDGTVSAFFGWFHGETNVPPGLSNVVAVAAGGQRDSGFAGHGYSLALKRDGTIATWGVMGFNYKPAFVPDGLSNVVAIAVSDDDYSWAITTNRAVAEKFLNASHAP